MAVGRLDDKAIDRWDDMALDRSNDVKVDRSMTWIMTWLHLIMPLGKL